MKKDNQNNTFNRKNLVLLIILIILFAFILWLHIFKFRGNNKPLQTPTGNVDIFEIECKCPEGKECEICETCSDPKKPVTPVKPITPTDPVKPEDPFKWEEEVLGFNVFDNQIRWETESELRIFTHPSYNFDGVIAPGVGNSYEFRVRNNNGFKIIYTMLFEEENESALDMRYRLKKNGSYVIGNDSTWVKYDGLNLTAIVLDGNAYDTYILDWLWFESDDDNRFGLMDDANYNLSIDIVGTEYEGA